ncbi:MAG: MotA/TolQ/ExbB proton channel family protein, partial [Verrucomicrobiota bacterium]|nr:MotA/TolQ/ExbB proton channel family protein [Verrucomicrobiota bacterium]
MSKKFKLIAGWVALFTLVLLPLAGMAQELEMEGGGDIVDSGGGMGLWAIIAGSGWLGIVLWGALFACSVAAAWLAIDFFVTIKPKKIIPEDLVNDVREAMEEGDVIKAMQRCEQQPGALSNILLAGFRNVKEGFEVIQEQVGAAADLESEKLMQRVSYLNMCGSISPMLGLLGTVQGMIMAFANLATTQAGAAQQSMLALNIAQAL